MFVGTKGVNIEAETGWDLTNVDALVATVQRPDETVFTKDIVKADMLDPQTAGKVRVAFEGGDLTLAGIYHIQIKQTNGSDVLRFTSIGTFAVPAPLPEV